MLGPRKVEALLKATALELAETGFECRQADPRDPTESPNRAGIT